VEGDTQRNCAASWTLTNFSLMFDSILFEKSSGEILLPRNPNKSGLKTLDDRTGRFVVEATSNGPEFRISIAGDRGGGIANVEIFCFDLALFLVVTKRLGGPGFLVHDSHLFDGVDERQVARALLLGARASSGKGQQYIVTMNSDIFNTLPLPTELDRSKIVLSTRLSDETETGGLFGIRFD
jgi:uncharacterized protein YydD (DUF2326 family)